MKNLILLALIITLNACNVDQADQASTNTGNEAKPVIPAGFVLVEEFKGNDRGISIPFTRYQMENGLTVILHEDHSDPIAHVDVTYHVGSNREEVGRSGFAHFFEHMMFQGSENVGDDEHFKIISNAGGTMNGSTNFDRTNYYQTVPVNQLETALWLEADRMGLLLDAVTQEKFEIQRETVKNERGQNYDNRPYGRVSETLGQAMYPEGHPYSWPTIGWLEDLDRAELNDLKRFFLRWYGPNNAAISIGGDIDVVKTLELVRKYFGPIPAGPAVENLPKQPATLDADRYLSLEDKIHLPAIAIAIPTVYGAHPDEPALDTAAEIMGGGQASLLYQRLVQTGRAVQASVSHPCSELACSMSFIVVQNPGSGETLAEMETAVRETIAEFAAREVNADDLQKFKAQYESGRVFGLQSVAGKVSTLAAFQTYQGSPGLINEEIERYLNVEADDVRRVFNQYIDGKPAVILSIVPEGATQLAAREPNFVVPERDIPDSFADQGDELPLRPVVDDFDRSQQPVPGINPLVELPPIWDTRLANGVRVLAVPNEETPTVSINAIFEMGQRDEPAGKAGLTSLTASLMSEATTERSAAEFSEALERIGASVNVIPGEYETTISLNTLTKHLDTAMALMMERILKPDFNETDFNRVKSQTIEGLMQVQKTPASVANRAMAAVLYGPEHPLSYPTFGIVDTVRTLTLEEVKAYYAAHIPAHLGGVLVSANLDQKKIIASLQGLAELPVSEAFRAPIADLSKISGRTLYLVNQAGAAQSNVRTAQPGLPYDALGDYYKAGLMNFALGGAFNSRINMNLREDKGYTYGARTRLDGGPELGSFNFSAEVNKAATAASVTEVLKELTDYATNGMSEEEYDFMRSSIGQSEARQYETPGAKLGLLGNIMRYDLPLNYRTLQKNLLRETDREALNQLATRLIQPDQMSIVVVGDEAVIRPDLEALGMPIKVLDANGYAIDGE